MKSFCGIAFACLLALSAGLGASQTRADPARLSSPAPESVLVQAKAGKGGGKTCAAICEKRCAGKGRGNCASNCLARCK
jgi:hypothetical protein